MLDSCTNENTHSKKARLVFVFRMLQLSSSYENKKRSTHLTNIKPVLTFMISFHSLCFGNVKCYK